MSGGSLINIGIIGLGNIGTAHANCIFDGRIQGARLSAICDINKQRLDYAKDRFPGVRLFESYEELISSGQCNAVIVSTPHRLHAVIAGNALLSGIDVLVEKPVDISAGRAKELNAIAEKSGRVFAVMFNQRTDPLFIKLREIIKSGEMGKIKSSCWIITNWYRTQHYYDSGGWRATWSGEGGGVLLNQAVHNLDLWQWILTMPCEITAFCDFGRYHRIEVEDSCTIYAKYPDGSTGVFITSTGECPGTNRLEISAEFGKAVLENGSLKLWKLRTSERKLCFEDKRSYFEPEYDYFEYTADSDKPAHQRVIQAFADAIINGSELVADGCEGINELMISNAAYLSQWLGNKPVSLPIDDRLFDDMLSRLAEGSKQKTEAEKFVSGDYSDRWNVNW